MSLVVFDEISESRFSAHVEVEIFSLAFSYHLYTIKFPSSSFHPLQALYLLVVCLSGLAYALL